MSPIIPLADKLPEAWESQFPFQTSSTDLALDHLLFFEPEVLVETRSGQLADTGIQALSNETSNERLAQLTELEEHVATGGGAYPRGIPMDLVFDHLKARVLVRGETKPDQIGALDDNVDGASKTLFDEVVFGLFPMTDSLKWLRDLFESLSMEYTVSEQFHIPFGSSPGVHPFHCAVHGLSVYGSSRDLVFFIFDPCSPVDVVEFWNYRLIKSNVIPLNVDTLQSEIDVISSLLEHAISSEDRNGASSPLTIYAAPSLNIEEVERSIRTKIESRLIDSNVLFTASNTTTSISMSRFKPEMISRGQVSAKSETINLFATKDTSYRVLIPVFKPDFVGDSMTEYLRWVNVWQEYYFDEDDELASGAPSAWLREFSDDFWGVWPIEYVSREGHVSVHTFPDTNRQVSLRTRQDAIYKWLSSCGFEASPSDAGRIADEVISFVGGLNRMHLCANTKTIKLFNDMAVGRRKKGEFVEELPWKTASIGRIKSHISKLEKNQGVQTNLLQQYVNSGILQLGLVAKCEHCTKQNWYSLDEISSEIQCERCLKHFLFPEAEYPSQSIWKYRVVGPFSTPNYAEGAYSVALSLAFLKGRRRSGNAFTYVTGTELSRNKVKYEIDFLAWHRPHRLGFGPDPSTLIGECKSFGENAFDEENVKRLKEMGKLFPKAFLVASTLKSQFDEGEITLLRGLAQWSWSYNRDEHVSAPLILLTGNEILKGVGPYGHRRYPNKQLLEIFEKTQAYENFTNLARATQEAYLRIERSEIFSWGKSSE